MNSELAYLKNPGPRRIAWIGFYLLLLVVTAVGIFRLADRMETHKLPVGYITIHSTYSKYAVGEPITISVQNNLSTTIYVGNECPVEPLTIYRQEGEKWVRIHAKADLDMCKLQDREIALPANTAATVDFSPWQKMFDTPGKYRVVAVVEHYDALPYEDFEVVALPPKSQPKPGSQTNTINQAPNQKPPEKDEPQNLEQNDN